MARAYTDTLNKPTSQLNTSAAHRERLFIEDRLKAVKHDLDEAQRTLASFQVEPHIGRQRTGQGHGGGRSRVDG